MNKIKHLILAIAVVSFFHACDNKPVDEMTREELIQEIEELKAQLAANSAITSVAFEGNEMVLTFANGQQFRSAVPTAIVPQIGSNGNWFVNGVDLGVSAEAKVPVIKNGTWWVDGVDTGVSAAGAKGDKGDKGDQGEKGDTGSAGSDGKDGADGKDGTNGKDGAAGTNGKDGTGIKNITYDPETGLMTITLTDNTTKSFILSANGSGEVGGNPVGELKGEYLIKSVYNGDLPFLQMVYNDANKMTALEYHVNVFNEPVKRAAMNQTYNAQGKVATSRLTEYAEIDKYVAVEEDYQPNYWSPYQTLRRLAGYETFDMTIGAFYTEIFGGTANLEKLQSFASFLQERLYNQYNDDGHALLANSSYAYSILNVSTYEEGEGGWNGSVSFFKLPANYFGSPYSPKKFVLAKDKDSGTTYMYCDSNCFPTSLVGDDYDNESSSYSTFEYYESSKFTYNPEEGGFVYNNNEWTEDMHKICHLLYKSQRYPVVAHTSGTDPNVTSGKSFKNYYVPSANELVRLDGVTGTYKVLVREYSKYSKGDEIENYEVLYAYDPSGDYTVNPTDMDAEGYVAIVMDGDKFDSAYWHEDISANPDHYIKFNYTDGKLTSIDCPSEGVYGFTKILYDGQGNPIELQVDASELKDKDMGDFLYTLGLIYKTQVYNPDLGLVVEDYVYPTGFKPILKMEYNYGFKNFMNYTITATHPILSFLKTEHALSELIWAGHGSAMISEYSSYNENGYPEKIKALIQASYIEDGFEFPVNGSIAATYKLKYVEQK